MVRRYSDFLIHTTMLIIFALERGTNGETNLQITGYPGSSNQLEFYVYTQPLPWREAVRGCREENLWIMGTWTEGLAYVKSVALNNEGWSHDGFWIGYVHHADNTEYSKHGSCEHDISSRVKNLVNHYDVSIRQCLYVNMSTPNTDEANIYAGPCEREMPYLCNTALGEYSGDPDSTVKNKYMKFKTQDDVKSYTVNNQDGCIDKLFGTYSSYAAEFDSSTQSCRVKRATTVLKLPIVFEIEYSTDGETVLHKNTQPVEFRSIVKNVEPIQWPCWSEPVVNGLVPGTALSTSEYGQYSASISTLYSSYYKQIGNETCCACHSTKTIGDPSPLTLLDKRSLSRFKMQKISASDSRVSATTIGCFGALTLVTVCCVIMFSDVHSYLTKTRRKRSCKSSKKK